MTNSDSRSGLLKENTDIWTELPEIDHLRAKTTSKFVEWRALARALERWH